MAKKLIEVVGGGEPLQMIKFIKLRCIFTWDYILITNVITFVKLYDEQLTGL